MTETNDSSDETNSTDAGSSEAIDAETPVYRNDPAGTFGAHLFAGTAVEAAGGMNSEQSERPVSSLCARTTSYGQFLAVDPDDLDAGLADHSGDLCDVCRDNLEEHGIAGINNGPVDDASGDGASDDNGGDDAE
jgi:hypothetical protein